MTRATILFVCFNQERFVRAAVRDALAQDYEDLEIYLSDDCSTDNSFLIIQEEAKRYEGPHKVIVNRTPENLGLNKHIGVLLDMSQDDIIIPFAGDDRFRPDRARKLVERLIDDDALLVHSYADCIGLDNEEIPPIHSDATLYVTDDLRKIARSQGLFIGATAAWRRDLFTKYGPLPEEVAYEDLILGFRAALEGRISLVEEPLVRYRVGTGASFQARSLGALDYRARRLKNLMVWRNVLLARRADATTYGLSRDHPVMQDIQDELFDVETRLFFCGVSDAGAAFRKALVKPRRFLRTAASELNRHFRKRV
ncbi:glycosyltransferase [Thioclava sp. IC9]|uniref:glycosyltransferase n=1 Tax=Thioclava sp. IC9 TaxID=1973007 RepID=UPI001411D15C|nr:glycosyltransferase [Thioclava sp. IC9]